MGHSLFEMNCGFHFKIFYKDNIDSQLNIKVSKEFIIKLKELTAIYRENL